ncbi:MAG: hypothetical protein NT117_10545 [Gammaproteobacteria bacterium]|nr:hypothetical protein [Gammaproteobacteria bacterium]
MRHSRLGSRRSGSRRTAVAFQALLALGLAVPAPGEAADEKFVVVDDGQAGFTAGPFTLRTWSPGGPCCLIGPPVGTGAHTVDSRNEGVAIWNFGVVQADGGGSYSFEAYLPDVVLASTGANYWIESGAQSAPLSCAATQYSQLSLVSAYIAPTLRGSWFHIGTVQLAGQPCVRVVVGRNPLSSSTGNMWADAIRMQRLFEDARTIPDMPKLESITAPATNFITSASNAAPTVLASISFACPRDGNVTISASGESAAVSTAGSAFIGLAYSISKDSTATDNSNVVQSSALSTFAGDANRDFLYLQRVDSCTEGLSVTYRLTGYATTAQTKISGGAGQSFIWNPRLIVAYTPF